MKSVGKEPEGGLKAKLEQQLSEGNVNLSSSDMAEFHAEEGAEERKPVEGTATVPVPKEANQDMMMNNAAGGEPGTVIDKAMDETTPAGEIVAAMSEVEGGSSITETVEVTEAEREAFINALITGDRYVQKFSLCGGAVAGKFRCRTQTESQAIISQLNRECKVEQIESALDYSTRLRNMLLAAQVFVFKDQEYAPLKEPLMQTKDGDKVTAPGWLDCMDEWDKMNEGLVAALYNALQLFEKKYWTMVRQSSDQNFWNPEESTSE